MPRIKSIKFQQNIPKIKLFLQTMQNLLCAEGSAPKPPCLQRLGALLPDPQLSAAGGFDLRPPNTAPLANFWLRVWCFYCCYIILWKLILRLAGVCGFPQAALSLTKFAHPWTINVNYNFCLGFMSINLKLLFLAQLAL